MASYGRVVVIKRDGKDGAIFPLQLTSYLFGRGDDCDVRIQLPDVLKEHCKLVVEGDGELSLTNLAKTNPTLINGKQFMDRKILCHNDVFTVADRSFRVEMPAGSSSDDRILQPVSTNNVNGTQSTNTPAKQVSGKTPAKLVQSASLIRTAEQQMRTSQPLNATSFYKARGENEQMAASGTGAKLVSRSVTPSRVVTPSRMASTNKTNTPTRSSSLDSGLAYKAKTPSAGKVNLSGSGIQTATGNGPSKLTSTAVIATVAKVSTPGRAILPSKTSGMSPARTNTSSKTNSPARNFTPAKTAGQIRGRDDSAVLKPKTPAASAAVTPTRVASNKETKLTPKKSAAALIDEVKSAVLTSAERTTLSPKRSKSPQKSPKPIQSPASHSLTVADIERSADDVVTAAQSITTPVIARTASPKKTTPKTRTPSSAKFATEVMGKADVALSLPSTLSTETPANISSPRGIKRSGGPLNGPRSKKRGVSFGPQMSPEVFDERLPPKTPVKRGQTPRRASVATVVGSLKPVLKGRKSDSLLTAPVLSERKKVTTPNSKSPAKSIRKELLDESNEMAVSDGSTYFPIENSMPKSSSWKKRYSTVEVLAAIESSPGSSPTVTDLDYLIAGPANESMAKATPKSTKKTPSTEQMQRPSPTVVKQTPKSAKKRPSSADQLIIPATKVVAKATPQSATKQANQLEASSPVVVKQTPKSARKRSLSADPIINTESPVTKSVTKATLKSTKKASDQVEVSSPAVSSPTVGKATPKSSKKQSLSAADLLNVTSPATGSVAKATPKSTKKPSDLVEVSSPAVSSPAVVKPTPKSARNQSLSADPIINTESPFTKSVTKATPKSTKKASDQVEVSSPAVSSPTVGKATPKSSKKQSLSAADLLNVTSPATGSVAKATPKSTKKPSDQVEVSSPAVSSPAVVKPTPKSARKRSLSADPIINTESPFTKSVTQAKPKSTNKASDQVEVSSPAVSSPAVLKPTPKSQSKRSLSADPIINTESPFTKSVTKATPKSTKKASDQVEVSSPAVSSPTVGKATPKSSKKQSLSAADLLNVTSPATGSVAKATPKSTKKPSDQVEVSSPAVSSPAVVKPTPKSARKRSLSADPIINTESPFTKSVTQAKPKSTNKASDQVEVSSPAVSSPAVLKPTPKSQSKRSLSADPIINTESPFTKSVTKATPKSTKKASDQVEVSSPAVSSPTVGKATPKSSKKQSLSAADLLNVTSPATGSVAKATPKSTKKASDQVEVSSPAVSSPTVGKATPKSSKKQSLSAADLLNVTSPATGSVAKATPKSTKKPSDQVEVSSPAVVKPTPKSALVREFSVKYPMSKSTKRHSVANGLLSIENSSISLKKKRASAIGLSSTTVISKPSELNPVIGDKIDVDASPKSLHASKRKSFLSVPVKSPKLVGVSKRSSVQSAKKLRRSVVDVETLPRVVAAGLVTPGRAVAMRAIFGKSATSNLKNLLSTVPVFLPKTTNDSSSNPSSPLAKPAVTTPAKQAAKAPMKSAKKSVPKKKLWSEVVAHAKAKSTKKAQAKIVKPVIVKPRKALQLLSYDDSSAIDSISSTGHAMSPATIVIGKRRRTTTHAVLHEISATDDVNQLDVTDVPTTPEGPGEMMVSPIAASTLRVVHDSNLPVDLSSTPNGPKSKATNKEAARKSLTKTPNMEGLRKMLKTPVLQKTPVLVGLRDMMKTPKSKKTPKLVGLRELVKTPKALLSPDLTGVKAMLKTPKAVASPRLDGIKQMLKTPKVLDSPNLTGVRNMLKTPKALKSPQLTGVREMLKTPAVLKSPDLTGVKELMRVPKIVNSPQLDGLGIMLKTPKLQRNTPARANNTASKKLQSHISTTVALGGESLNTANSPEVRSVAAANKKAAKKSEPPTKKQRLDNDTVVEISNSPEIKSLKRKVARGKLNEILAEATSAGTSHGDIDVVSKVARSGREGKSEVHSVVWKDARSGQGAESAAVVESVAVVAPEVSAPKLARSGRVGKQPVLPKTSTEIPLEASSIAPKLAKSGRETKSRAVDQSLIVSSEIDLVAPKVTRAGRETKSTVVEKPPAVIAPEVTALEPKAARGGRGAKSAAVEISVAAVTSDTDSVAPKSARSRGAKSAAVKVSVAAVALETKTVALKAVRGGRRSKSVAVEISVAAVTSETDSVAPKAARSRGAKLVAVEEPVAVVTSETKTVALEAVRGSRGSKSVAAVEPVAAVASETKTVEPKAARSRGAKSDAVEISVAAVTSKTDSVVPKAARSRGAKSAAVEISVAAVTSETDSVAPKAARSRGAKLVAVEEPVAVVTSETKTVALKAVRGSRGSKSVAAVEPVAAVASETKTVEPKAARSRGAKSDAVEISVAAVTSETDSVAPKAARSRGAKSAAVEISVAAVTSETKTVEPKAARSRGAKASAVEEQAAVASETNAAAPKAARGGRGAKSVAVVEPVASETNTAAVKAARGGHGAKSATFKEPDAKVASESNAVAPKVVRSGRGAKSAAEPLSAVSAEVSVELPRSGRGVKRTAVDELNVTRTVPEKSGSRHMAKRSKIEENISVTESAVLPRASRFRLGTTKAKV